MKLEDAVKIIEKSEIDLTFKNVATYGFIYKTRVEKSINVYCHAGLNHVAPKVDAVFNVVKTSRHGKEVTRRFYEYLLNFSSYSNAILDKDVDDMLNRGYYILRTDIPGNYLGGAAQASRFTSEHDNRVQTWYSMVERGVNPDVALVFSHKIYKSDNNICFTNCGHSLFNGMTCDNLIWNFAAGKQVQPISNYYGRSYYGTPSQLWMDIGGPSYKNDPIIKEVSDIIDKIESGPSTSNNPFVKNKTTSNKKDWETAMDKICPHIINVTRKKIG